MRSIATLLLCITFTFANSSNHLGNYFFMYCPENSAVAEAGVAQVSTLGSIRINPANGAIYAKRSGVELIFEAGGSGFADNWGRGVSIPEYTYSVIGKSFRLGYFPAIGSEVFNWGVVFAYNNDKHRVEDLVFQMGTFSFTNFVDQTTTTFSLSWAEIFSFGIGFDITSYSDQICIDFSPMYQELYDVDSDTLSEKENQFDLNLGIGLQYQFALTEKLSLEPALGASILQIGKDSLTELFFDMNDKKLTIPTSYHLGGRITVGYTKYLQFSSLFDRHYNHLEDKTYTDSYGWEVGFTPLGWVRWGYLKDSNSAPREEFHGGLTLGYNGKALYDFFSSRGRKIRKLKYLEDLCINYSLSLIDTRNEEHTQRDGLQGHKLSLEIDFKKRKKTPVKPISNIQWDETELGLEE